MVAVVLIGAGIGSDYNYCVMSGRIISASAARSFDRHFSSEHRENRVASISPSVSDSAPTDVRLEQLRQWLQRLFQSDDFTLAPASEDASFRRYFRVMRESRSWIAMDAPPQKENIEPYVRIAHMLVEVGVNAPHVLETNLNEGFLLNSDLGGQTYLTQIDAGGDVDMLYHDAMDALVRIQANGLHHAQALPPYDAPLLRREMELFPDWFCCRHLQLTLGESETHALQEVFDALTAVALEQPRVFVHRDYHSRNLMVTSGRFGPNPGILDFQDAVCGPVTYDLVSLLRDCYVAWPIDRVHEWVTRFREVARSAGVDTGPDEKTFLRWFDLMGVQRHLKAIGIFARLWHRDGKAGYLKDIPRTLNYVRVVCAAYPELRALRELIDRRVMPALQTVAGS
jgi:aminoglycoside/choline kinase family phosphotransferase